MAGYRMAEYEEIAKFYEREKERMKADLKEKDHELEEKDLMLEEVRQRNAIQEARIRELEAALAAK